MNLNVAITYENSILLRTYPILFAARLSYITAEVLNGFPEYPKKNFWIVISYKQMPLLFKSFLMALQPLWALAAFESPDIFTIGRTPWTSDQLVARPLTKHRTA
jgi:hypothetical protein